MRDHGASGIGASIYFRLNSFYTVSSSILGIIFGGFTKGIENENFIQILNPLFVLGFAKFILTGSKY